MRAMDVAFCYSPLHEFLHGRENLSLLPLQIWVLACLHGHVGGWEVRGLDGGAEDRVLQR